VGNDAESRALNRAVWREVNAQFTDGEADHAWVAEEIRWGLFAAPETELDVLGELRDVDVLDLACGTGYFSAWMARRGARVVALDMSAEQLASARRCQATRGPVFPLLLADAEQVPLAADRFDLVLSEHGAAAWCDPDRWVPEAARVLRPGGRLIFLTNSLLSSLCVPSESGPAGDQLLRGQRDVARVRWPGGGAEHHPSHGDWIAVLRRHGFIVEQMREIYAPAEAVDHGYYGIVGAGWAAQWPAEELWVARLATAEDTPRS
jgi:SAM-dependent methyltransferase